MSSLKEFLAEKKVQFGESLAEKWSEIEELFAKRLYHQLTLRLLDLVKQKEMSAGTEALQLYDSFIVHIEKKLNPFMLMEIVVYVVPQIVEPLDAINFLSTFETKLESCPDAVNLCKVLAAQIYLDRLKDFKKSKAIIDELQEVFDDATAVSLVHGRFFCLAANYYRLTNNHAMYYQSSLRYLGCIDLKTLPNETKHQQAFFLCLAALLGKTVYNLGELLAHPVMDSMKGSDHEWLIELVKAFNKGDIDTFVYLKPKWLSISDLQIQESFLREKLSLLCLLEMAFQRPPHNKQLHFDDIVRKTRLPHSDVELLIMRAMSIGLIRGSIDYIEGVVNVTWLQPRVLDHAQIACMAERLDQWCQFVTSMENLVETKSSDIIAVESLCPTGSATAAAATASPMS